MKVAIAALAATLFAGCAPSPNAPAPDASPPIARVWRNRCGLCHVRVQPGTRDHDALVAALSRHHARVKLTDAEWEAMLHFLESKPVTSAPPAG